MKLPNYPTYQQDKASANKLYETYFPNQKIDWNNPTTFNEKIQIFKLSDEAEELWQYVDKYEVRKYVKKTIGEKYLNTLYGVYNSLDEIDFVKLPHQFILKCTHGSGYNIICEDKTKLDWSIVSKKVTRWMGINYYDTEFGQERQYKRIKPRIVVEKFLTQETGALRDYKFFCFSGKPIAIEAINNRFTNLKRFFFDISWKRLSLNSAVKSEIPDANDTVPQPENLEEMLDVVTKLAAPFRHVRVDLYNTNGKILFGELTFSTANGVFEFNPPQYNEDWGKLFLL